MECMIQNMVRIFLQYKGVVPEAFPSDIFQLAARDVLQVHEDLAGAGTCDTDDKWEEC